MKFVLAPTLGLVPDGLHPTKTPAWENPGAGGKKPMRYGTALQNL